LPSKKTTNYHGSSYKTSNLEECRAELIDSLYDVKEDYDDKLDLLEINLKRKLGILTRDVIEYFLGSESIGYDDESYLELDKNLKHGCKNYLKFCQKDIEICRNLDENLSRYVYACDMCNYFANSKVLMKNHLKENHHLSSSIYFMIDNDSSFQLKSRCAIRNQEINEDVNVFCPKCYFCFGTNILACCLHYKYLHKPANLNILIYSIVAQNELLKKNLDVEITKEYKCLDCQLVFNKLQDFSNHLNEFWDHHLNPDSSNVINIFYCPNIDCEFKSIDYPSLRFHVIKHNNLYKGLNNSNFKILTKMKTFNKPKQYFHLKYFNSDYLFDQIDELNSIESSLKLLKLHRIHDKFISRLEERIVKLRKTIEFK